uniref:Armadillo repeat-containing protein 8 n=2 Tax=Hemiselmis andersenii TaxID=464988 RepID=A0A6U2BNC7_HEMAN
MSPKAKDLKSSGRSTSVPASARSGLLDNNVLALSTGTTQERAAAARRICSRVRTGLDLNNLVQAGVVGRVAALLSEPKGMDAAVDGLIPLCSYIGGEEEDSAEGSAALCAEVETHSIVERLSAVLCWASSTDDLKGRIAMLMFYMAKVCPLANRIVRQDGALKSLVQLLDCADQGANTSAAAALANISYWSTEPIPRYSQLRVICAL